MIWHVAAAFGATGAWLRWSVGWWLPLLLAVVAAHRRSRVAALLLIFVLAGWLGDRAEAGLDPPPAADVDAWVVLTGDPRPSGSVGVRASARWGSHRVSLSAHGPVAGRLDDALAGEQVHVIGSFRPGRPDSWTRWRHEVGTIIVTEVQGHVPGSPLTNGANAVRRLLQDGVESLDRDDRAVFSGMVVGDDREQSAVVADDFRAAGLGHLVVVSGQNVAFVLALLDPLTRRTRPANRLVLVILTLLAFVTLTRFEASVLRAAVMAGAGVGAAVLGGPVDGRRALSLSILLLVLIDPFLVRVLAFQLSVAATGGIVWGSGPLAGRLPGPAVVRVAVATTVAAQLAVAPLLIATFGPIPLAGLPANVLAGPVSGPIMMWGCTGGVFAGLIGGPVAAVIHTPTDLLVGWVRAVAAASARAPGYGVGWAAWAMFCAALTVFVAGRGHLARFAAVAGTAAGLALSLSTAVVPPAGWAVFGHGVSTHRSDAGTVIVLNDPGRPRDVLEVLRTNGVRTAAAVIATDGDRADADAVVALRERFIGVAVLAPPMHRVPGGRSVPDEVGVAGVVVELVGEGSSVGLAVRVAG
jgi:competence protein ComEC